MISAEFWTVGTNSFWDFTRFAICVLAFCGLAIIVRRLATGLRDNFTLWCFLGLASFHITVIFQIAAAWRQEVPVWRVILMWVGMFYATRALYCYRRRPQPQVDLDLPKLGQDRSNDTL